MSGRPLYYTNPLLGQTDPYITTLTFQISQSSGAATYTTLPLGAPVLAYLSAPLLSGAALQAQIDAFCGVPSDATSEFTTTNFNSTTCDGVTGIGMIINMGGYGAGPAQAAQGSTPASSYFGSGQCQTLIGAEATAYTSTGFEYLPNLAGTAPTQLPYQVFAPVGSLGTATGNVGALGRYGDVALQFKMTDGGTGSGGGAPKNWASFLSQISTGVGYLVVKLYWLPR